MHRFFITNEDSVSGGLVRIMSEELVHQMANVLRFRVGEKVALLDGEGDEIDAEILEISKKSVICRVVEKKVCEGESPVKIVLYQAMTKNPERFEFVLQKGTEVGISEFVPLITARTERQSLNKIDRLGRILKEAAEQSGRGIVPVLGEVVELKGVLKDKPDGMCILADPSGKKGLKEVCLGIGKGDVVNIFIGPEGGLTEAEVSGALEAGFEVVNLGKRILRAETAGMVVAGFIGLNVGE